MVRAFCAKFLHRLPSEIDAPIFDLYASMIALDMALADAEKGEREEFTSMEEFIGRRH